MILSENPVPTFPDHALIDILLESALFLELGNERNRLFGRARAELCDDIDQRTLDVLGHSLGVATDIDMGALGQPAPEVAADLAHAVLHIELLVAIAGPGKRQTGQQTRGLHGIEFVPIKEIAIAALMAKEQPVLARRAGGLAIEEEQGAGAVGNKISPLAASILTLSRPCPGPPSICV